MEPRHYWRGSEPAISAASDLLRSPGITEPMENVSEPYLGVDLRNENQDRTTRDCSSRIATAMNPGCRGVPKRRSTIWTRRPPGRSSSGAIVQTGYWEKSRKTLDASVPDAIPMTALSFG